nr:unnamed protein product [Spirometra erinaceieuropaei]
MSKQLQLRWSGQIMGMEDTQLPKLLFYGAVATDARRPRRPKRAYKDALKNSLKRLNINPEARKHLVQNRAVWIREVNIGAAIYAADRITAAKARRKALKSKVSRHLSGEQAKTADQYSACLGVAHLVASCGLATEFHPEDDEAVVLPAIDVADRLDYQHLLSISPPNENIVQQLLGAGSGVHPGGLLPHRQAKECVGQHEETIFLAVGDSVRTPHSPSGSTVCPDAGIEVINDCCRSCRRISERGTSSTSPTAIPTTWTTTTTTTTVEQNPDAPPPATISTINTTNPGPMMTTTTPTNSASTLDTLPSPLLQLSRQPAM